MTNKLIRSDVDKAFHILNVDTGKSTVAKLGYLNKDCTMSAFEFDCGGMFLGDEYGASGNTPYKVSSKYVVPQQPKTKVEYVRVELTKLGGYNVQDLFFHWSESNIVNIKEVSASSMLLNQHKLRLKVETEVAWQDELSELQKHRDGFTVKSSGVLINEFIPSGSFIEICHLVASMTDKPKEV